MDSILSGTFGPSARVWLALLPALLLFAYFLAGLIAFAVRERIRERHTDEVEARGSSVALSMWLRRAFSWWMQPLFKGIVAIGLPATAITMLSLLLAIGAGFALAAGRFALGGWLYLFAGICDFLDGRIARMTDTASQSGAALDSILDRYAEAVVLIGLGWYYRESWVLLLVMASLVGSFLVSYIRARGASLGVDVKEGFAQRPERIFYLGVLVALSPIIEVILDPTNPEPFHLLAVIALGLLAVSSNATAVQRLVILLSRLHASPKAAGGHSVVKTLPRDLVSAAVATAIDFSVVALLVSWELVSPAVATAVGVIIGGIINFTLGRVWAFAVGGPLGPQVARYLFVWVSSAVLNSAGVAVVLLVDGIHPLVAWGIVRALVYLAWNYSLRKDYIFPSTELTRVPPSTSGR